MFYSGNRALTHQSQPQHGPVRQAGLIVAHQPVSWRCIVNEAHGRVDFPAATFPSLDCKANSCCFSVTTS